eukprot:5192590-Pyramimonas_sp.AAC.1
MPPGFGACGSYGAVPCRARLPMAAQVRSCAVRAATVLGTFGARHACPRDSGDTSTAEGSCRAVPCR